MLWLLKVSVSYAEGQCKLTTSATTLPQIINRGLGLERPHHCTAEKYTHQTSYFWFRPLHVVEFLFLPHPWISNGWYRIPWPYARKLYERYHLQIGWIRVGYRNQHKVKHESVFKPLSQRWVPKVYFYADVNGYGSTPPYGCKIEWSLWKKGTKIIEGEHGASQRPLIPLSSPLSWLDKYTGTEAATGVSSLEFS